MNSKARKTTMELLKGKAIIALSFGIFWLLVTGNCSLLNATDTGGQVGQFLAWGAGGRSLGMGRAFFAVADDASATYWNPAGLTQLDRKEVMALHVNLFADTNYDFLSYVHPTPKYGVFGVNLTRLYSGGFEKIGITYDPTKTDIIDIQNLGTFDDVQTALTLAYGKKIKENISIGIGMSYINHTLDTSSNGFLTFNADLLVGGVSTKLPDMRLAFGVSNLISSAFGDTDDQLPIIMRMGVSQPFLRNKLLVDFDIDKNMKADMEWHLGTEYWVVNFAAIRLGFTGQQGITETAAGFGIKYKDYGIDYAFGLMDLGMSQRISGSWKFGPSISQNRDALVKRYMQEGMEAYRQGNFLLAYNRLDSALEIDQANKEIRTMVMRLQTVVSFIPAAAGESEDMVSIRKGVAGYAESDDRTAINSFRYAYFKNPENIKLLGLVNRIEKETGVQVTPPYKEDVVGFTMIDQKVYDARQAIIDGKYDQALIKCQEILNLEPNNTTALEIMGSAFFMMDQPDKARAVWMKVIELDPTNKVVPEFLNQLNNK